MRGADGAERTLFASVFPSGVFKVTILDLREAHGTCKK